MSEKHYISRAILNIKDVNQIIAEGKQLALSEEALVGLKRGKRYLDEKLKTSTEPIYGINTGFGSLCDVKISGDNLSQLQENLVMSHACGTGEKVPKDIVRIMLLLKVQSLSYGYSGVQVATVQRLIDLFNEDILPVIYTQGSLGASGDLAPLAHLSLPLLGKGELYYKGEIRDAASVLKEMKWEPIALEAKEGLALLNGTQFMSAYAVYLLKKSHRLSYLSDLISAISLDAYNCRLSPFNALLHVIRPHSGQIKTAKRIMEWLEESAIATMEKESVQDPYSFRCIPQVHGATKDTINFVTRTIKTEINSVTDNPNVFPEDDLILSGGNFHGQTLALALDYLGIAMAELGNISERRTYKLIGGERGLPPFLVKNPGLNSGLMIPQYTAASMVSLNKQLASPSSVDSITSSNGQEDHVSMGANAATQTFKIIENVERILAIELLNASQALSFRNEKTGEFLQSIVDTYRKDVPIIEEDRVLAIDIENSIKFLQNLQIDDSLLFD
ncbi:MAG TPA: histidine ammonia-lyase [Flavobacteriaceae bacterium]|nr:histidine ammonia-lyase [Flavobacteriaceae bacterium]